MTEDTEQVVEETYTPEDEGTDQRVQVGLHPLGGIGITCTGADGTTTQARIGIEEAWLLQGQLAALTSFVVGSAYAQAMAREQAAPRIVVPGAGGIGR